MASTSTNVEATSALLGASTGGQVAVGGTTSTTAATADSCSLMTPEALALQHQQQRAQHLKEYAVYKRQLAEDPVMALYEEVLMLRKRVAVYETAFAKVEEVLGGAVGGAAIVQQLFHAATISQQQQAQQQTTSSLASSGLHGVASEAAPSTGGGVVASSTPAASSSPSTSGVASSSPTVGTTATAAAVPPTLMTAPIATNTQQGGATTTNTNGQPAALASPSASVTSPLMPASPAQAPATMTPTSGCDADISGGSTSQPPRH